MKKAAWSPTPQRTNRRRSSTRQAPDPTAGDDIRGEDLEVRKAAVEALGKRNGLVVITNPTNGRILTIVNQKLALSTGFQPCSTFKPAVALAALKEGIITDSTEIRVNRRTYMTMTEAIAVSNNPFFVTLGKKLGFARVREYAARWGFGQKAGWNIEGEDPGVFPDRPPYRGVGYLCSHGAGIKATALQMAAFVSALANGGDLYYLQYPRTTGEIVNFRPRLKRKLFISQYLPKIKNAMAATVLYGTGSTAYDYDHTIYGKTGTCTLAAKGGSAWGGSSPMRIRKDRSTWLSSCSAGAEKFYGSSAARIAGQVYRSLNHNQSISPPLAGLSLPGAPACSVFSRP